MAAYCHENPPGYWFGITNLVRAFLMSVIVSMAFVAGHKSLPPEGFHGLIAGMFVCWTFYYTSYYGSEYGAKRPSYPCYHLTWDQNGIPNLNLHWTFYANAHPWLFGIAIALGLALGAAIIKYDVGLYYIKKKMKREWKVQAIKVLNFGKSKLY